MLDFLEISATIYPDILSNRALAFCQCEESPGTS